MHNLPEPCPVHSPCWCEVAGRENNPHCKTSVPINEFLSVIILIGLVYGIIIINRFINKTLTKKILK